ncbi:MAG: 7-cyano-7-deazaguanine synthase QueC [Microthrixaceae bacterium]
MTRDAVVLVSGGLDSATVLAQAVADGFRCNALSFRYGQRHSVELEAAERVASTLGAVRHEVLELDLGRFGGSALTDDIDVPKEEGPAGTIPITYVPARNTVFLSLALAWAEVLGADHIFIGVNAVDYSGYPDCRPEFIAAFETLANVATAATTEGGRTVEVHAPLIELSKAEIISLGTHLGVDYSSTISCYDPDSDGAACGSCESCRLRAGGFAQAGIADPTRYALS